MSTCQVSFHMQAMSASVPCHHRQGTLHAGYVQPLIRC